MEIASYEAIPSVKEFFPSIKNVLVEVNWAQGIFCNESLQLVLEEKVMMINGNVKMLTFPLWLHANTSNMEEKDIDKFLSLCTHNFPEATISIGMLHKGQTLGSNGEYTAELVTQMKDTLTRNNVTQTVAFPVEMVKASYSLDTLPALKDVPGITDSALYMHTKYVRPYQYDELPNVRKLLKIFGKDRVYLNAIPTVHMQLFNRFRNNF
uniref:Menorin-like domain-containing protein n=1 Tax=Timema tahoe TaxID=61484 RepID=A0A7R9P0D7_9NEOP|nr:unnamed protein product [Timema tahoe]